MERKIEFRIKDNEGKWHYGCPVFFDDGSFEFFDKEKLNDLLPYEECGVGIAINKTLGQYVGLKDKHGNKIYEGDIVKDDNEGNILFVVKYTNYNVSSCGCCTPHFTGIGFVGESNEMYCGDLIRCELDENCEVVGNIYD